MAPPHLVVNGDGANAGVGFEKQHGRQGQADWQRAGIAGLGITPANRGLWAGRLGGAMVLPICASEAFSEPVTSAGKVSSFVGMTAESSEPSTSPTPRGNDHTLLAFGRELHRLWRRITVLERRMQEKEAIFETLCAERGIPLLLAGGFPNPEAEALRHEVGRDAAWQAWSSTIGRAEQLADRMRRLPARSVEGLSAKFDALLWALYHNRPDLFEARRLAAFGRYLVPSPDPRPAPRGLRGRVPRRADHPHTE